MEICQDHSVLYSAIHIILSLRLEHLSIDAAAALCKLIMGAVFLDGILRKYGFGGMLAGVAIVCALRFLSHFLAGVILWANLEQFVAFGQEWVNRPVLYSIVYNGSFMLPELILTTVGAVVLLKIPQISRLIFDKGEG